MALSAGREPSSLMILALVVVAAGGYASPSHGGPSPGTPGTVVDRTSLAYSTFFGGSERESIEDAAVGADGTLYYCGWTESSDFPATPGAYDTSFNGGTSDAYVAAIDPNGSNLVFATFLGGTGWEGGCIGLALDQNGDVVVVGRTSSSDFPTSPDAFDKTLGGFQDGFLSVISRDGGQLLYSTYIGGALEDIAWATTVDDSGRILVTGYTESTDFVTTPGAYDRTLAGRSDAFILRLPANRSSLEFSTYLGGAGSEVGTSIGSEPGGTGVFVSGRTFSGDFPTTAGAFDRSCGENSAVEGFITRLASDGSTLDYSTCIGGDGIEDEVLGIEPSPGGEIVAIGLTQDVNFPTTPGAYDRTANGSLDGFLLRMNAQGNGLVYSTFLGGASQDNGVSLAVDGAGRHSFVLFTHSSDIAVTLDAFDRTNNGNAEIYFGILDANASSLIYGTYLGGASDDFPRGVDIDLSGASHVFGFSQSSGFPTTPAAYDRTLTGTDDGIALKFTGGPPVQTRTVTFDTAPPGLKVTVGGTDRTTPYAAVCVLGSSLSVGAPSPQSSAGKDYEFVSWSDGGPQSHPVLCDLNQTIIATFREIPKPGYITVKSDPPGLNLTIDNTSSPAPLTRQCVQGDNVTIGAPSPQSVGGKTYGFANWSDGGSQSHDVVCSGNQTFDARFAELGASGAISVISVPAGLRLTVAFRTDLAPFNEPCLAGSLVPVAAPSPQTSGGKVYRFLSWSDSGAPSHDVTCTILTQIAATFAEVPPAGTIRIATSPPGLNVSVDGHPMKTPFTLACVQGDRHWVSAPPLQTDGPSTRYLFSNWSDLGSAEHEVACGADILASYSTQFRLTLSTEPLGLELIVSGAEVPSPHSYWCASGVNTAIEAPTPQVHAGRAYEFARWSDGGARSRVVACVAAADLTAVYAEKTPEDPGPSPGDAVFAGIPLTWLLMILVIAAAAVTAGALIAARRKRTRETAPPPTASELFGGAQSDPVRESVPAPLPSRPADIPNEPPGPGRTGGAPVPVAADAAFQRRRNEAVRRAADRRVERDEE